MSTQNKYIVCIRCMTFNHAPYIKDAMDGFCMQETSFPFVCVIVDDASTDGEPNVIRTYMGQHFNIDDKNVVRNVETDDYVMSFAQHKTNENCFFAVYYLKYNHYSIRKDKLLYFSEYHDNAKYIALCEGDDYWIDKKKLKKQVAILEKNNNVMLVHTGFKTVDENNNSIYVKKYADFQKFSRDGDMFARLLWRNYIMTLTCCIRKEVLYSDIYKEAPASLDYLYFLTSASLGDIVFVNDVTSCYRITSTGATATEPKRIYNSLVLLSDYFSIQYVKGKTRKKKKITDRIVTDIVLLTRAFRDRKLLWKILVMKKRLFCLLPISAFIKVIDFMGLRYIQSYNELKFYDIFTFDVHK